MATHHKHKHHKHKAKAGVGIHPNPPVLDPFYVNFRGYSGTTVKSFAALCGEDEPKITGGYAEWHAIKRPLRRGITVFDGYSPAKMEVNIRFGVWRDHLTDAQARAKVRSGWDTSTAAGQQVETDIASLEWMAGAHRAAGQSPYVYVNTLGNAGGTTALVPLEYQNTRGITGGLADPSLWPWVIDGGVEWGKAWREQNGYRTYQEAKIGLMAFEGFSSPPQFQVAGSYFKSKPGRDDPLLIAGAPSSHALYVDALAQRIIDDPKNNPITGHKFKLKNRGKRGNIPHGYEVWVPVHQA